MWSVPDWPEIGIDGVISFTQSRRVVVTMPLRGAARVTDDDIETIDKIDFYSESTVYINNKVYGVEV